MCSCTVQVGNTAYIRDWFFSSLMYFLGSDMPNSTLRYIWYSKKTNVLQVVVEFGSMNQSAWCDDIDLWIQVAEAFSPFSEY